MVVSNSCFADNEGQDPLKKTRRVLKLILIPSRYVYNNIIAK